VRLPSFGQRFLQKIRDAQVFRPLTQVAYRTSHNTVTISQNVVTFLQFLSILSVCLYLHAGIFKALRVAANRRPACLQPVS
jgi:hypothetical protein